MEQQYFVYSPDCTEVIGHVLVPKHVNPEIEASNALRAAIKHFKDHVAVAPAPQFSLQ